MKIKYIFLFCLLIVSATSVGHVYAAESQGLASGCMINSFAQVSGNLPTTGTPFQSIALRWSISSQCTGATITVPPGNSPIGYANVGYGQAMIGLSELVSGYYTLTVFDGVGSVSANVYYGANAVATCNIQSWSTSVNTVTWAISGSCTASNAQVMLNGVKVNGASINGSAAFGAGVNTLDLQLTSVSGPVTIDRVRFNYPSTSGGGGSIPPGGTATINVTETPCTGGSWSIVDGPYTGTSNSVPPLDYTITNVTPPAGATLTSVTNSDGGTYDLVVGAGQTKSYTLTYGGCAPTGIPKMLFSANPTTVPSGQSTMLHWTVYGGGATSCTASSVPANAQWTGAKPYAYGDNYQEVTNLTQTTTFSLFCSLTGWGSTVTRNALVTVTAPTTATINVVESGASGGTWTVNPGGFTGASNIVTPAAGPGGTTYSLTSNTVPSGYTVSSITSTDGGNSLNVIPGMTKQFTVNYVPAVIPFNYSLSAQNASIYQTSTGQSVVTETYITGTAEGVNISASGLPSGVSVSYANQGCTPNCSATITFTVGGGVTPGTYPITITGTSVTTGVVKNTSLNLTVQATPSTTVTVTPNPSGGTVVGQPVIWTAVVSGGILPCSYVWSGTDIPGGSTGTVNTYTFTYQTTGPKSVSVTATCTPGSGSGVGNTTIGVNPLFQPF